VHLERAVRAVAHRDDGLDRAHDAARAVQHDRHLARRVARHQAGERRAARLGIGHPLLERMSAQLGAVGAEQGAESWRGIENAPSASQTCTAACRCCTIAPRAAGSSSAPWARGSV
jgi:hypothetical protein